ncbi:MAG: VWA domain-containing protein [Deltaproteobacteria bacterium]|nr:VWA domain-containing protein [Deltaproteobacteria bacterium]
MLSSLLFAAPAGVWALLFVPALLLIHLLRRRAKTIEVTTLFLLDRSSTLATPGRSIERLRSSASLWLQLVAILISTWVLMEPRFVEPSSVLRVVLVIDGSASMSAFREQLWVQLDPLLDRLERAASHTEWIAINSDSRSGTIYSGTDRSALASAIRRLELSAGTHELDPALLVARNLRRGRGPVIVVTDHSKAYGPDVHVLSVGSPLSNVGFAGVSVARGDSELEWTALVKSFSKVRERRSLKLIRMGSGAAEQRDIELEPGRATLVRGEFGLGVDSLVLRLEGDAFTLDDALPIVRPKPKRLRVFVDRELSSLEVVTHLLASLENVERVESRESATLSLVRGEAPTRGDAISFGLPVEGVRSLTTVFAAPSALTEGLSWSALDPGPVVDVPEVPGEAPILWQADRAIALERVAPDSASQLVLAFAPEASNAARVPAFAVLLLRFCEKVRGRQPEFEARNLETRQLLGLAAEPTAHAEYRSVERLEDPVTLTGRESLDRAPSRPGFFVVKQDDRTVLAAAVAFADPREGDLSSADSSTPAISAEELSRETTRPDPLRSFWLVAAAALALASWRQKHDFGGRR